MQRTAGSLVTAVIPTFNYAHYIESAIDSVLAQTYPNIELIVVDDGSTDHTAEIVRDYGRRLRYIYQENGGIGAARNTGVRAANGDYLAFLDADDHWEPEKTEWQLAVLQQQPSLDIVYGHARQYYSSDVSEGYRQRKTFAREVLPATLASAMLIRREAFARVGPFDDRAFGLSVVDQHWFLQIKSAGLDYQILNQVVYHRRLHETNCSVLHAEQKKRAQLAIAREAVKLARANR